MNSEISSHQMKRFVKHLCIVSKRYYEREKAHKNLALHLRKIKKTDDIERDLFGLNKKINLLLEKEAKVAELGMNKKLPSPIQRKIKLLEAQLEMTQEERDKLSEDNEEMKKYIESLNALQASVDEVGEAKEETDEKVEKLERQVDKRYHNTLIDELKDKIKLLESSYKEISKDKTISPARLYKIEEKLEEYKNRLRKIKS